MVEQAQDADVGNGKAELPTVNMFWHGPRLGEVHAACVRSFLRHGHPVRLHCYEPPSDTPDGVEVFDAAQVMPQAELVRNTVTGSVALGVNRYRYRMIRAGMGLYSDCDIYCFRPISDDEFIFGWEDSRFINNAFLKYPPDSELARALVSETETEFYIPDWMRRRDKYLLRTRRALGRGKSVCDMPWGIWGPVLLTHWVRKLGLARHARPVDHFYPMHYFHTELLFEPGLRIEDLATPRSFAVHLCHKMQDRRTPPPGSPLRQIIETP